jgi:type IV pilus assembly protein PilE
MERSYAVQGRYTTAAGQAPVLPVRLQAVPGQGEARYKLRLESVTPSAYLLRADPVASMADDGCGSLTLASTGAKGRTGSALSAERCWQ